MLLCKDAGLPFHNSATFRSTGSVSSLDDYMGQSQKKRYVGKAMPDCEDYEARRHQRNRIHAIESGYYDKR
jgi:hypothetical protein